MSEYARNKPHKTCGPRKPGNQKTKCDDAGAAKRNHQCGPPLTLEVESEPFDEDTIRLVRARRHVPHRPN
jgi:hypothetical protein